jgi:hypothetical protein
VQAYALSDPAAEVRNGFIAALSGRFNLPPLEVIPDVVAGDDVKKLQEQLGEAAILDFKTDNWRLDPGPMTASLRVLYGVRARFLVTSEKRVFWQGYCFYNGKDSMATAGQLKANSGALLHEKMREAASFCAKMLAEQLR